MKKYIVSLIGVHGVGKTYTASILKDKYGFRYFPIEVISREISSLNPVSRQVMFFVKYVEQFMNAYMCEEDKPIVLDSHPLLVIPYTYWWIKDPSGADRLAKGFVEILKSLPKVDLLVYLRASNPRIILERILSRKRFNLSEEYNRIYVESITIKLEELIDKLGEHIAKRVVIIPAEFEGEKRAEIIYEMILTQFRAHQ